MITSPLLEKTRMINKILQGNKGYADFSEIAEVLKNVINANVYLIDREGAILGHSLVDDYECEIMVKQVIETKQFTKRYNDFLLKDDNLRDNLSQKNNRCPFLEENECLFFTDKIATVIPIMGVGKRLGTLLLARFNEPFGVEDLIMGERGATVVGMEILRSKADENEEETRQRAIVKLALSTLSYSETEAIDHVFRELDHGEGLLVASKIADQLGITRSVIVNALRKLESAGVTETRSLGMKGTFIRVLNPYLYDYLKK
jgi:transcriptional pleiotropic repressor